MGRAFHLKQLCFEIANKDLLLQGRRILSPEPGRQGFPDYPELPVIVFEERLKHTARELEWCGVYWLISDRLKVIFEQADPSAFAFYQCKTAYQDGTEAPVYWMCDVIKILDAVDEEKSNIDVHREGDTKIYKIHSGVKLKFKKNVIEGAHVFRLKYSYASVLCDSVLRNACKENRIQGLSFIDVENI